jgi:hypothetical protein
MKLGCSLCGWNNLEYYKNYNNLESLLASINTAVDLSYYELPFLFHDKDHQNKILQYANSVFSVHASKTVFNKDQQYIISYFKEINEYCSFLNCKVVVVPPPEKKSINKIELQ